MKRFLLCFFVSYCVFILYAQDSIIVKQGLDTQKFLMTEIDSITHNGGDIVSIYQNGHQNNYSVKNVDVIALLHSIPEIPFSEQWSIGVDVNIDNPLIMGLANASGDTIYIYGEKDNDGYPASLSETVFYMSDGKVCDIIFNNDLPTYIETPDGFKYFFEWTSETMAAVTIYNPLTGGQINTYVDLDKMNSSSLNVENVNKRYTKRDGEIKMSLLPMPAVDIHKCLSLLSTEITSSTMPVKLMLKNCETLVDGTCFIDVYEKGNNGKFITKCSGKRISKGVYEMQIPKSIFTGEDYKKYINAGTGCEKIVNAINAFCDVKSWLDIILWCLAIQTSGISSGVDVFIDLICQLASDASKYDVCNSQMIKDFKEWKQHNIISNSLQAKLVPYVLSMPNNIYGYPKDVKLGEPIEDMEITWGGTPNINSFTLSPSLPLHGQSYVAKAELYCIPSGSTVYMNIKGTDGYYNEKTIKISSTSYNYTATLNVPGAATGVKDVCNIIVTTSDGKKYSKTASLIFQ